MSDLISRKALLEELEAQDYYGGFLVRLITNAPSVEQCEPVTFGGIVRTYKASPPQPQEQDKLVRKAVKDALEKAASICDDRAKYMKEMIMQDVVVGKADTGAMVCANAIRALIEE